MWLADPSSPGLPPTSLPFFIFLTCEGQSRRQATQHPSSRHTVSPARRRSRHMSIHSGCHIDSLGQLLLVNYTRSDVTSLGIYMALNVTLRLPHFSPELQLQLVCQPPRPHVHTA